jgi:hypothetical protein
MAARKNYPKNYPSDVLAIIDLMAFNSGNVMVAGSMSLKSQQYAGDYDMVEVVDAKGKDKEAAAASIAKRFQAIVRALLKHQDTYIGDIKWGEVSDWRVVEGDVRGGKVIGYDAAAARAKLTALVSAGVVSAEEAEEMRPLLKSKPTPVEFLEAQRVIRPQVVRWTPKEVLAGFVMLRNGHRYTLEEGVLSPAICKLDVVGFVQRHRFTDFSILYQFRWDGKTLNPVQMDPAHEIRKNIIALSAEGDTFKMAKRIFALIKNDDPRLAARLTALFNGDMGRLYAILSDIGTILFLLENESVVPTKKIQYQVGQFRARLGNIFETDKVNTERVLDDVLRLETASREQLKEGLMGLQERLQPVLNRNTTTALKEMGLLPLPKRFIP